MTERRDAAVVLSGGGMSLEPGFRSQRPWTEEAKRALLEQGHAAADEQLAAFRIR